MKRLIAGEAGSVLAYAASDARPGDTLALEGLREAIGSAVPISQLPEDVNRVELLDGEASTREVVRTWAIARGLDVVQVQPRVIAAPVRVIAIASATTGSGKTATTRKIARSLKRSGVNVAVVRHPMASMLQGDPRTRVIERPDQIDGPIDVREELAPIVGADVAVVIGLDPASIVEAAAARASVIVWDGGGSGTPWVKPDLQIAVVDLVRYPPEATRRLVERSAIVVLTKADTAKPERAAAIEAQVREWNPDAAVLACDLNIAVPEGPRLLDRRVVIVEDAPSLMQGGLKAGAGAVAARRFRCGVVDSRQFAVGAIAEALATHPHIAGVIPSLGRTKAERADFAASVRATPGDVVLWASPASPDGLIDHRRPVLRVYAELMEVAGPSLQSLLQPFLPGHD